MSQAPHGDELVARAQAALDVHTADRRQPDARAVDPRAVALERDDTLVLLVDVQERLAAAMDPAQLALVVRNQERLLRTAQTLRLPIVASEQYRKGLGATLPQLAALLPEPAIEKLTFSCGGSRELAAAILRARRRQVVVCGMETHVCVFQTVRDLVRGGLWAHVPQDAVLSRTESNRAAGLRLIEKAGATVTSTETVIFDLLGVAGTPEFKALAPLLK